MHHHQYYQPQRHNPEMMMSAQAAAQVETEDPGANVANSPLQIISDIEPMIDSTVSHMQEVAQLRDN